MPVPVLRSTPERLDLELWAGDDEIRDIPFIRPPGPPKPIKRDEGPFDIATPYDANVMVESVDLLYVSKVASTGVIPATDPDTWFALRPFDLNGYTNWAAQIRASDSDANAFAIDTSRQAQSWITISIAGETLRSRMYKGPQFWDLQALTPDGHPHTFYTGRVFISEDATR